jgi:hypothetical protein
MLLVNFATLHAQAESQVMMDGAGFSKVRLISTTAIW